MKIYSNGKIISISNDGTNIVNVPIGTIVIWSGTADDIPAGWALCDGQDGRPDLRNKFIIGAGDTYAAGATGGSETVALTASQMPSHSHMQQYPDSYGATQPWLATSDSGDEMGYKDSNRTVSILLGDPVRTASAGSGQAHDNMPPYYALCYIVKIAADPAIDPVTINQVNTIVDEKLEETKNVYSLNETVVGTWIDGKPVYRWCGKYSITANNHNYLVGNLTDCETIIRAYGGYNNKSNSQFYAIPRNDTSGSINMAAIGNAIYSYVAIQANTWDYVNGAEAIVFVEYTKTTDSVSNQILSTMSTAVSAGI